MHTLHAVHSEPRVVGPEWITATVDQRTPPSHGCSGAGPDPQLWECELLSTEETHRPHTNCSALLKI